MKASTNREVVAEFLTFVGDKTGFNSDDMRYSKLGILRHLQKIRASLLQRKIKTSAGELGDASKQFLDCVEMIEVSKSECPCVAPNGCTWLRTKHPLPLPIAILSVTNILGTVNFDSKQWTEMKRVGKSRIKSTQTQKYYTTKVGKDGVHLYLYNEDFIEHTTIVLIPEDPICAAQYPSCGKIDQDALCSPLDLPFKLEAHLLDAMFNIAFSKLPQLKRNADIDYKNNSIIDLLR